MWITSSEVALGGPAYNPKVILREADHLANLVLRHGLGVGYRADRVDAEPSETAVDDGKGMQQVWFGFARHGVIGSQSWSASRARNSARSSSESHVSKAWRVG